MVPKKFKLPSNNIINPEKDYFSGKASISWKSHDRNQAIELCKTKNNVIDVGAHVGITTVHWLSSGFNRVYAFEMNPSHFECLVENTIDYKDKITYYPYGCGNTNSKHYAGYRTSKNSGTFQMIDPEILETWNKENLFEVEIKKIDDHTFENISLIKIDVEGWELEVLQGSVETISKHKPILFVEYGHGNHPKTFHKYDDSIFQKLILDLDYVEIKRENAEDSIFVSKKY